MKQWLEERLVQWLTDHGYIVVKREIPLLVVVHGTGTMKKLDSGATEYHIHMPAGHRLWTFSTLIVEDKGPPPKPRK